MAWTFGDGWLVPACIGIIVMAIAYGTLNRFLSKAESSPLQE